MRVATQLLCLLLAVLPQIAPGQETQPRTLETLLQPRAMLPVPGAAAIEEAEKLVQEVFKAEIDKARTAAHKAALAKTLLEKAAETNNDPAGQFVLLRQSASLAASGGDVEGVTEALSELKLTFKMEVVPLWIGALETVSKEARTPGQRKAATEVALLVIDEALAGDDFESANKLGQIATVTARGSQDAVLIREVASRVKSLKDVEKQFVIVAESKKVLEANPTDPDANLVVGKYHCFVKGDWAGGAAMLVLGKGVELKKAAELDLANPATVESQVAVGDAWWSLAASAKEPETVSMRLRAAYWYRTASPTLTGLAKAKVAKRLEEVAGLGEGPRKGSDAASDPFQVKSVWVSDDPKRVLTVAERKGEMFRARFQIGSATDREVTGTIKGNRLSWLAKDVRTVKGDGAGGDNLGTIVIDTDGKARIDFVHGLGKASGTFTLLLVGPAPGGTPDLAKPEPTTPTFVRPAPKKAEPLNPHQILPLVEQAHMRTSAWQRKQDGLYNLGSERDLFHIPVSPARAYDLEAKVTRLNDSKSYICFIVPFGEKGLWLIYDWDQSRSGVDNVGKYTQKANVLPPGEEKTLTMKVRADGAKAYVGGEELFSWAGEPKDAFNQLPVYAGKPAIQVLTIDKSQWKISSIELRPAKD